ncbi:MAG: AmmeMemoRadiSam system protein B [Candidatus Aenigmatarchaeota archaeon]|nr:MAG: AmmeMemoRadiSam system protein B [Candidatus Aenigmarchaeota archaeon]
MEDVRPPTVSGSFYSHDKHELREHLSELFSGAKSEGTCKAVISPHAGYQFSGMTAAWAVKALKPARTFVILGPNHGGLGDRFSIMKSGKWKTPLGNVAVNQDMAKELSEDCSFLSEDTDSHIMEHSIEVQLPFLQHNFDSFDFVPISILNTDYSEKFLNECINLGKVLASITEQASIGIIASSDFSHYMPKESAEEKDRRALDEILKLDAKGLFEALEDMGGSVCGYGPIAVTMAAAKDMKLTPKIIHKSHSGMVTGDNGSVVSYYAVGFE